MIPSVYIFLSSTKSTQRPFRIVSLSLATSLSKQRVEKMRQNQNNSESLALPSHCHCLKCHGPNSCLALLHWSMRHKYVIFNSGTMALGGRSKDFSPWKSWELGHSPWGICLLNDTEGLMWGHSGHHRSLTFLPPLLTAWLEKYQGERCF